MSFDRTGDIGTMKIIPRSMKVLSGYTQSAALVAYDSSSKISKVFIFRYLGTEGNMFAYYETIIDLPPPADAKHEYLVTSFMSYKMPTSDQNLYNLLFLG